MYLHVSFVFLSCFFPVPHSHPHGRKEGNVLFNDALNTFYLRLYGVGHMVKDHSDSGRKEGNVLFNGALNTFYLRLYGVGHMVKDHSDSEKGTRCRHIGYSF